MDITKTLIRNYLREFGKKKKKKLLKCEAWTERKRKEKKCRKARLVLECYRKAMMRVPEEHTNAKSGSVGSAGKRGLECRNGAGQQRLSWKGGYRNARLEIPEWWRKTSQGE